MILDTDLIVAAIRSSTGASAEIVRRVLRGELVVEASVALILEYDRRMVQHLPAGYVFDPADPRSPSEEQWEAMTTDERRRVVDMLPAEPDVDFLPPAEGDRHRKAGSGALSTLDDFFPP